MATTWLRFLFLLSVAVGPTAANALVFAVNEGVTYRVSSDEIRAKYAAIAADLGKILRQPVTVEPVADYPTLRNVGSPDEQSITAWMVRASLRDAFGGTPPLRYVYTRYQDAVPFIVDNGLTRSGATEADGFGVMGYLFKKLTYPLAPLVLALVLGDMAEASFRQSMLLSQGAFSIFWANPLVAGITSLALLLLVWPLLGRVLGRLKPKGRAAVAPAGE